MENKLSDQAKQLKADYFRQRRASMTPEAKKAANESLKKWRAANPDKVRQYQINYWERKVKQSAGPPTEPEMTVVALHDQGLSLREIGRRLGMSHMTVKRLLQGVTPL